MGNGQQKQVNDEFGTAIQIGDAAKVTQYLQRVAAARAGTLDDPREARALKAVDLNLCAWSGATALQLAAMCGKPEVLRTLIDVSKSNPSLKELPLDARDSLQRTALHFAAARPAPPGCAQCVADLLFRKANPCIADAAGLTPLDAARRAQCQLCVRTIEDNVRLWQGWVDHDERKLLGLPNWQPRWLVVLRDRHPNSGLYTGGHSMSISCYNCRNVVTARPYVFQLQCSRCSSQISVTPSLQMALYASHGPVSSSTVLPNTAVPVTVLPVPPHASQMVVKAMEDASWSSVTGALLKGKLRRTLQSLPTTERSFGLNVKFPAGGFEHSFRVATEADRAQLLQILQNPVQASYDSWCASLPSSSSAAQPSAAAGAPPPPPPPPHAAPHAALASQALAAPADDAMRIGRVSSAGAVDQAGHGGPEAAPSPPPPSSCAAALAAEEAQAAQAGASLPAASAPAAPPPPTAPQASHGATGAAGAGAGAEGDACVVCLERQADTAVVPCGHLCGCESCLESMQSAGGSAAICPMCRGPMTSLIRIFRP